MEKGKWERVANVQGTKCNVPKLLEGHQYKFRVIAESPNGDSEPLELENPITAKNPYGMHLYWKSNEMGVRDNSCSNIGGGLDVAVAIVGIW